MPAHRRFGDADSPAVAAGGVPVAVDVAQVLRAPLDVLVVQRLALRAFPVAASVRSRRTGRS